MKSGLCPHGLPPGACPICSNMGGGGGLRAGERPQKAGEMSYHECVMMGNLLRARALAEKRHAQNIEQRAEALKAFENTKYQVIMSVGNLVDMAEFTNLPENINVYQFVDQIAVLSQADVFISHCGMNSVNESLYYGVPLVMYPQTTEQGGVANRVKQLNAGEFLKKNAAKNIFDAVEKIANDKQYRDNALKISDGFKKCSGAKGDAEKILSVIKK